MAAFFLFGVSILLPFSIANAHRTLLSAENSNPNPNPNPNSGDVWKRVGLFLSEEEANKLSQQTSVVTGKEEELIYEPLRRVFAESGRSLEDLHQEGAWGMDTSHGPCDVWISPSAIRPSGNLAEMPRAPVSVCVVNPGQSAVPRVREETFDQTILLRGLDLDVRSRMLSADQRRWLLRPSVRWLRIAFEVYVRMVHDPDYEWVEEERKLGRMLTQQLPSRCPHLEELEIHGGDSFNYAWLMFTGPFNLKDMPSLRRLEVADGDCGKSSSPVVDFGRLPDHLHELQVRGGDCAVDFCRFPSQMRAVQVRFTKGPPVSGHCVFSEARWPHLQEVVIEGFPKEERGDPWDPSWNQVVKRPEMMERAEPVGQ